MTSEQSEAERKALFEESKKRLEESGIIPALFNASLEEPDLSLIIATTYEPGMPAAVTVEGPVTSTLEDIPNGLIEASRRRSIIFYAGLNNIPGLNRGIEYDWWENTQVTILKDDEIRKDSSGGIKRRGTLRAGAAEALKMLPEFLT